MYVDSPVIMIVDDDPHAHFFAKRALSKGAGIEQFKEYFNGRDAITSLRSACSSGEAEVTHVLLDIAMPIMDGFEFLEAFEDLPRDCTKNIRVVLVSSSPNISDHRRALQHDCVQAVFEKALMPSDCPMILGSMGPQGGVAYAAV